MLYHGTLKIFLKSPTLKLVKVQGLKTEASRVLALFDFIFIDTTIFKKHPYFTWISFFKELSMEYVKMYCKRHVIISIAYALDTFNRLEFIYLQIHL